MSDNSNPYDPQHPTFPWNEQPDVDDVWDDPEPVVPLMPPPAVPQPPAGGVAPPARPAQPPYGTAPGQRPAYEPPFGGSAYRPPSGAYTPPSGAYAGYGAQAPGAGGAPYGSSVYPGYGYRGPASYGSGHPSGAPVPYGHAPAQAAQGSKGMAVTALVLSIVGAVTSLVLVGVPLAIVALILGIVALARRLNGKGMSIAAVIISSISLLWGVFVLLMFIFVGSLAGGLGYVDTLSSSSYYSTYADEDELAAMQGDVSLAEYAVSGRSAIPQYLVLIDNASADTMYPDITLTVNAIDADGEIIDTRTEFGDIYPGTNAFTGDFVVDSELVANVTVDVDGMIMQEPVSVPGGNPVSVSAVEVSVDRGEASATGTVENASDDLVSSVDVVVIERDAAGTITSYGTANVASITAHGAEPFTTVFPSSDTAPAPLTYDAEALASY